MKQALLNYTPDSMELTADQVNKAYQEFPRLTVRRKIELEEAIQTEEMVLESMEIACFVQRCVVEKMKENLSGL